VDSQDFTTTVREHVRAFEYFQGLAATCLYDNTKVIVTGYDGRQAQELAAAERGVPGPPGRWDVLSSWPAGRAAFPGKKRPRRFAHLTTPFVEELSGPGSGVVFPELLKGFLKKVGPDSFEVVAEQIAKPEALFGFQILFAFEQEPARFLQNRRKALAGHAARLSSANFVQSLVHLRHDMEAVEDVKRFAAFLADHS
jgi:hypothetical protein